MWVYLLQVGDDRTDEFIKALMDADLYDILDDLVVLKEGN